MSSIYTGLVEIKSSGLTPTQDTKSGEKIFIGHVLDVIKDENSPGYAGPETIGEIRVRDVLNQYNKPEKEIQVYARPLDRTNYRLPFPGEQVICIRAFGVQLFGRFVGQSYYMGVVTADTNVTNNIIPFLGADVNHLDPNKLFPIRDVEAKRFENKLDHKLDSVREKLSIQKVREGDKILEGRFGGSLKFSSTINSVAQPFGKQRSLDGDPIVILKNNRRTSEGFSFVDDDINNDDASVYLTTTQVVNLELACSVKMKTWNIDITTGETKSSKQDPSIIYQKIVDVTKPIDQEYTT